MPSPDPVSLIQWSSVLPDGDLHCRATALAVDGQGALILGASGSGKSGLALAMIALGATLIADDGVTVRATPSGLHLQVPATSPNLIEARGLGLLHPGPICAAAPLRIAIDLSRAEPDRLPPARTVIWNGQTAPLALGKDVPALPAALMILLRHGRADV